MEINSVALLFCGREILGKGAQRHKGRRRFDKRSRSGASSCAEDGEPAFVRNERLVCVEKGNHSYAHVSHIDEMGPKFEEEPEEFSVNYHRLSGTKYRIIAMKGPGEAFRCIRRAAKRLLDLPDPGGIRQRRH